jgi:tetratricopeptide (TPR) repeat protein
VIGYDAMRKTLLLRDPYERYASEAIAEPFLERFRATGPHAMVLVPREHAALLENLELPEAATYDQLYRLEKALEYHDRASAVAALDSLQAEAPEHRLTWQARRSLAAYDANNAEILLCVEALLKLFPNDANLRLAKLSCLRESLRADRLTYLEQITSSKEADPLFWQQYGYELSADAREIPRALRMLRRALRYRPVDANSFAISADILWAQRKFENATELYRFSACLEEKREQHARAFFSSSRHLKQTDAALAWLRDRFERFGALSPQPAITLFSALCQLEKAPEGFQVLESALRFRPNDGELLLFAADVYARWGKDGNELLVRAQQRAPKAAWLRTAAHLADFRGDRAETLRLWREVLASEPLALDAHRAVAQAIAESEGTAAAIGHLKEVSSRFPHHFALHQLWLDWLRSEGAEALEPVVRHLIEINSSDSWSHRELANVLADLRRYDQALEEAELARDLEPNNPYACCTAGRVLALAGRADEAREEYRKAIRLSVDVSYAIGSLVDLCQTHAERKEALRFVEHELIHQVVFGDGLLRFRELAHPVLEPEELLASLRVAMRERPDLWHAHSALVQQLTEMGRLEEALLAAREATARFPLLPRIWLDLARIHQARNHGTAEIEALEKALQINPSWSEAARQLANAHLRQGDLIRAQQMLEKAVALESLDVINHASLADLLWQTEQRDAALEEIRKAIIINPGYDRPWRSFRDWTNQLAKPELAVDVARGLIERRPGDTLSWLRLAEVLSAPGELPERLNALDKAIALNPRCDSAWDLRAISLARAHRWEEALAACKPPAWTQPPLLLRARAAWIERQRGNQTEALAQMRAVLKENPDSYFCWRELADWQWEAGNYADARDAATMLTRLAPFDPIPFGYSGDIKARTGDKMGAKADFRRALELDPKYTYAGFSLFDLQLEEDDLRGAAETLDILRKQSVTEWVRSRDAQVLLRKGDCPAALTILKELCLDPQADDRALHFIFDKAVRAGWLRETEKALLETMSNPKAHPYTGGMLVECRRIRGKWGYQRELNKFVKIGKAGENAIVTYLSVLGEAIDHDRSRRHILSRARLAGGAMSRIIRRHSEWLRKDDWAWGKTGYALFCAAKTTEGVKWLADWRERPQAQPWMLVNYIAMLHRRGHDAEANEVVQHVLSRPDQDNIPARFPILGAIEAGLNGHAELLNRLLSEVRSDQLSEFDKLLVDIPRLLQEFSAASPPRFGKPHRQRLSKFLSTHQWNNKSLLRVYYRAARFISQRTGSRWPIVWAYCRHYGPIVGGIAAFAIVLFLRRLARLYPPP